MERAFCSFAKLLTFLITAAILIKMDKIEVVANSKNFNVRKNITLEIFATELGLNPKRCVAEVNGNAVRAADFCKVTLADGDKIEIMQIVAGG